MLRPALAAALVGAANPVPAAAAPEEHPRDTAIQSMLGGGSANEILHELPGGVELRARSVQKYKEMVIPDGVALQIQLSLPSGGGPLAVTLRPEGGESAWGEKSVTIVGAETVLLEWPIPEPDPKKIRPGNVPLEMAVGVSGGGTTAADRVIVGYAEYRGWEQEVAPGEAAEIWRFVTPDDPHIREIARPAREVLTREGEGPRARLKATAALFTAFRDAGLEKRWDPSLRSEPFRDGVSIDPYNQFPSETLYRGGDCEDLSIAYVSALLTAGVAAKFLLVPNEHVFVLMDSGATVRDASLALENAPLEWFVAIRDGRTIRGDLAPDERAWLPLDPMAQDNLNPPFRLWSLGFHEALILDRDKKNHLVVGPPDAAAYFERVPWWKEEPPRSFLAGVRLERFRPRHDDPELRLIASFTGANDVIKYQGPASVAKRREAYLRLRKWLEPDFDIDLIRKLADEEYSACLAGKRPIYPNCHWISEEWKRSEKVVTSSVRGPSTASVALADNG